MLTPASRNNEPTVGEEVFEGLLSQHARDTLASSGYLSFSPSSAADVDDYVRDFSALWARRDDGPGPEPAAVLQLMRERESSLYALWRLALRNDFPDGSVPLVAQAAVTRNTSPFIVRSQRLKRPLVVMSEGLWSFVSAAVMGVLHWAEGTGRREAFGLELFRRAAHHWVTNDPQVGLTGTALADAATLDMETGVFGVGLADAVFTWAFLHEMGHYALGHIPTGEVVRGLASEGGAVAVSMTYEQMCELAADEFGSDRFLGLMPYTLEIRKTLRFGPQIDHAPVVGLELFDLAYRLYHPEGLLATESHPPPLVRRDQLLAAHGARFSEEGREWYAYWEERFAAFKMAVMEPMPQAGGNSAED